MQQRKHIRFDWAIKRLLRQKANFGILEGFLSELLKDDIKILEILESESNKETDLDKFNRVDILVKDQKGDLVIVEVQNSYALDYFQRILYGVSKVVIKHMKEGNKYSQVKKIISVNIVYFELGHGDDYIYRGTTNFVGIHDNKILELSPYQSRMFKKEKIENIYPEIYLIKVNKFDDNAKDTLDEWIYFLKNSEIKSTFSAKGIREADETLKRANMTDQERREHQRFVEVLSDRASAAYTIEFVANIEAEKKAEILAEEKAKILAEEKAKIISEEKMDKLKKSIVINLAKNSEMTNQQIAQMVGVSEEFVAQLRNERDEEA